MSEQVGAGALDGRLLFSYVKCMSQELGEAVPRIQRPMPSANPSRYSALLRDHYGEAFCRSQAWGALKGALYQQMWCT